MKRAGSVSIKWKVFLYLLGFFALLLAILWLMQTVLLDRFYVVVKRGEVQKAASSIAASLEKGEDIWDEVVRRGDLMVELWSEEGGNTGVPGNRPQGFILEADEAQKAELMRLARAEGGFITLEQELDRGMQRGPEPPDGFPRGRQERQSILYAGIVTLPDGEERLLTVSAEITPVDATAQTLRVQLIIISGLMALLAVVLALLIARKVSRPIERLNDAAAEWGDGNYDVVFEGGGYSEIGQLADTLNTAAGELAKTEALQRELVANVSHDLRTPLTLITGYAEMMRDLPDEDTTENMQVIIDEATRLSGLVADLMDLSQLQSGTGAIRMERFELTGAVQEILGRLAKLCETQGITIGFEYSASVMVEGDERRIGQVVYNFLINAMTYTGKDHSVTVRQKLAGGRVRVEVADTGDGIPAEQLPHIWQRYYRANGGHRRSAGGSGLGLSIARQILDAHPGVEYGVESHAGKGSVFWFSMPVEEQ